MYETAKHHIQVLEAIPTVVDHEDSALIDMVIGQNCFDLYFTILQIKDNKILELFLNKQAKQYTL